MSRTYKLWDCEKVNNSTAESAAPQSMTVTVNRWGFDFRFRSGFPPGTSILFPLDQNRLGSAFCPDSRWS